MAGIIAVLLVVGAAAVVVRSGDEPMDAGGRFLDSYLDDDGRVVRRDQGGDTVSEGQAYAMLVTVAAGDRARFDRAWRWAQENLLRPDGLLSWHWADGGVVDEQPASDADLDAAHALVLAGQRFGDPALTAAGARLAAAVLDHETVTMGGQLRLAAGPWAIGDDRVVVNPSYAAPAAFAVLGRATGDPRWEELLVSARAELEILTEGWSRLPPDWAAVGEDGTVRAATGPSGEAGAGTSGFDAVRVPVRWAASCTAADREPAARLAGALETGAGVSGHPVGEVARAAALAAGGRADEAGRALSDATAAARSRPTYYGSAWVALASAWSARAPC
ncbi:MAG: glycosyl hydrolase family 8 [Acidimicrobiia bacterium]